MKFAAITATLVLAATSVAAETNANRMARGLPPMSPARRASRVEAAKRHHPSNTPPSGGQCNTGPIQCCNSTHNASDSKVSGLLGLLGISVGSITGLVGLNCSPLSAVGVGGNSCSQQPVCCSNNSFNGLIVIGCSPININL